MRKMFLALLVCFSLVFASCGAFVSDDYAINAVEKQGYRNVKIRDRHIVAPGVYGCSKGDVVAFEAWATNSLNKEVDIIICAGWPFKGVTVRTN